ncbi:MAG: ACP S-malonyltransferase [Verrucomicrobiota bacterium]|nr:ACP S-malonyltransferase [Verrucomicrobiota bacterium]
MATALLFSGQGAQRIGMGKSLYNNSASAKALYDRADAVLGWSLTKVCFEGPEDTLTETRVCQPALYVHGYLLAKLLLESKRAGEVKAALGLSLGELTALAVAEAFDFETGLKVVAERGRLMQLACEASSSTMTSLVGGDEATVAALCNEFDVEMANLNCPGQIVISGETAKVNAAAEAAKAAGKFKMIIPLKVAGAYHSRLMEPARVGFEQFLKTVVVKSPKFTVFTNVTGSAVSSPDEIKAMLVRQVVSSVRWESCMRSAAALGITEFYECGPGAVLAGMAKRTEKAWKVTSLSEYGDI